MTIRRRDLAGAVFALTVAALCVGLGFWQLHRLRLRRGHNARILAARARPPLDLEGRGLSADSARDRRIRARGVYDYAHERVWAGRTREGAPGVAVLTPLRLPDGSAVFVDRGWVPSADARHADLTAWREPESVVVTGLGLPAPRERGDVRPSVLADSLPYPLLPFVVQVLPADSARTRPAPLRWPAATPGEGPHLSYAIQWFSFAVIIVIGTIAVLRQAATAARGVVPEERQQPS
jgi:surfeit locus 1 family protein